MAVSYVWVMLFVLALALFLRHGRAAGLCHALSCVVSGGVRMTATVHLTTLSDTSRPRERAKLSRQ